MKKFCSVMLLLFKLLVASSSESSSECDVSESVVAKQFAYADKSYAEMPPELLYFITEYLNVKDILTLSTACRTYYQFLGLHVPEYLRSKLLPILSNRVCLLMLPLSLKRMETEAIQAIGLLSSNYLVNELSFSSICDLVNLGSLFNLRSKISIVSSARRCILLEHKSWVVSSIAYLAVQDCHIDELLLINFDVLKKVERLEIRITEEPEREFNQFLLNIQRIQVSNLTIEISDDLIVHFRDILMNVIEQQTDLKVLEINDFALYDFPDIKSFALSVIQKIEGIKVYLNRSRVRVMDSSSTLSPYRTHGIYIKDMDESNLIESMNRMTNDEINSLCFVSCWSEMKTTSLPLADELASDPWFALDTIVTEYYEFASWCWKLPTKKLYLSNEDNYMIGYDIKIDFMEKLKSNPHLELLEISWDLSPFKFHQLVTLKELKIEIIWDTNVEERIEERSEKIDVLFKDSLTSIKDLLMWSPSLRMLSINIAVTNIDLYNGHSVKNLADLFLSELTPLLMNNRILEYFYIQFISEENDFTFQRNEQ